MSTPTIHQLRARGFKVRVTHERYEQSTTHTGKTALVLKRITKAGKKAGDYGRLYEMGGVTTVEVTDKLGGTVRAESRCSLEDPFNRRLGNTICLGRLHKQGVI